MLRVFKPSRLKSMRAFDVRSAVDDAMLAGYNCVQRLMELNLPSSVRGLLDRNLALRGLHAGRRCFIIGNGPSIRDQDLTLLRDEFTFAVNRFIHHELAEAINPTYYCIIDRKFASGDWGTGFARSVEARLPNATLFLSRPNYVFCETEGIFTHHAKYMVLPNQWFHFGYSRGIDLTRGIPGGENVTKSAVSIAVYMGFSEINLVGIDGNGLILSEGSHFYGHEPAPEDQLVLERALVSMSMGLRGWRSVQDYLTRHKISLISRNPRSVLRALRQGEYPLL